MPKIIEASENLKLETMLTVVSDRGDEFIINSDKLAMALANALSEQKHETKMGWNLENAWFKDAFMTLRGAAIGQ